MFNWLNSRYNFEPMIDFMKKKKVPMGPGWIWYYMGGVALFLFIVQIASGILLLMYYKASLNEAYESVQFIVTQVNFGWLVRSIHSWSANFMMLVVVVHMFSVFFQRAYAKPRELTWVTGFILLLLTMGFGFSGYLLPWNEIAFFATKVGTDIVGAVPFVGKAIMVVLRGGEEVSGATLPRFFGFHVAVLPLIFLAFLGMHLLFIQLQGMHIPKAMAKLPESERKYIPFFPHFMLRDLLLWLIVLNILAVFAVFFPWELGLKADMFAPAPANIRPEWYFVFMFEILKLIPAHVLFLEGELVGILGFGLGFILWALVPFIDNRDDEKRFAIMKKIGIALVLFTGFMTIWGYV